MNRNDFDPEVYEFYKPALEGAGFAADFTADDLPALREYELERLTSNAKPYEFNEKFDEYIEREGLEPMRVRVYIPAGADAGGGAPVILYFHGGGFVMGSVEDHDVVCGKLSDSCKAVVLSVDYRLAPESPFPACIEDAVCAAGWAVANAYRFGGDPGRLMAAGDSSGANISAVLALLGKEGNAPEITRLILFYGTYGCVSIEESESAKLYGGGDYVLPVSTMEKMIGFYAPEGTDLTDERFAPGLAGDLTGMPPAVIVSAEFDPLRDDSAEFARRLTEAGNEVTYIEMKGMMHGFIVYWQSFHKAEELIETIGKSMP